MIAGFSRTDIAAIAVGGVLGAFVRWVVAGGPHTSADWFEYQPASGIGTALGFPTATLVVNLAGCLLLGGLSVLLRTNPSGHRRRLLIGAATGFCGSLTTFSTFAVDTVQLLRDSTEGGSFVMAIAYLVTSVSGAAVFFGAGRAFSRRTFGSIIAAGAQR